MSPCGTRWHCSSSTSCGPSMSVLSLATQPEFSEAHLSFLPARQKILGSQFPMMDVLLCLSNQFTRKMNMRKGLILQTQEYSTHLLRLTFDVWQLSDTHSAAELLAPKRRDMYSTNSCNCIKKGLCLIVYYSNKDVTYLISCTSLDNAK